MINIQKPFSVSILSGEGKSATVRYPTDAEWCERYRRQKSTVSILGRGKTKPIPIDPGPIDADLFHKIRVDINGVSFSDAEAATVVGKLDRAKVISIEREGNSYRIELEALRTVSVHVLQMPSKAQAFLHERGTIDRIDSRRSQEVRVILEPSNKLYDELLIRNEGYVGGVVPINHKFALIFELLNVIEQAENPEPVPAGSEDENPEL